MSSSLNGTAYATVNGTDWAGVSTATGGFNNVLQGPLGGYQPSSYATGNNVDVGTSNTVGSATVNTLRFNVPNSSVTVNGTLTVSTGGLLVTPGATAASPATIGGTGLVVPGGGNESVIINNGVLNINASISDGTATNSNLTVAGSGVTTFNGNNFYTGSTVIDQAHGRIQRHQHHAEQHYRHEWRHIGDRE